MLLAALIDVGASLAAIQSAVDVVMPDTVRLTTHVTTRGGLRALSLHVELLAEDQPGRSWASIRTALEGAALDARVKAIAIKAFNAVACAEANVHGVNVDDVHFHEVGAWDSIADIVGVAAAVRELDVDAIWVSQIAVGSGTVKTQHGTMPVPTPAVADLLRGWSVSAAGHGELTTPTGAALATTLTTTQGSIPAMIMRRVGTGAGARNPPDRPNVVRVILGDHDEHADQLSKMALIETNVDDMDPRLWPSVLEDLLEAGAADAWLTPVIVKKGRPGHQLSVLASPELAGALRARILRRTTALGVRQSIVRREVLSRCWIDVPVIDGLVAVKIGHHDGVILHVMPEFDDVAELAMSSHVPEREVLELAAAASVSAGLVPAATVPESARPDRQRRTNDLGQ